MTGAGLAVTWVRDPLQLIPFLTKVRFRVLTPVVEANVTP